ncbi:MAG: rRNA maturation RNase YbeY [Clostridia bacterium]|nr:rRNA maturation RNase YbeY [Clostridia bacterium]
MTNFTVYCEEEEFPKHALRALEKAVGEKVQADIPLAVELVFVDGEEIQRLNRETRGIDKVTDVLSYPALDLVKGEPILGKDYPWDIDEEGNLLFGSIAICVARAREQAEEYGHSYERELHYLLVHGILHCLGYDHMTDEEKSEMRAREEEILGVLGIVR